MERSTRAGEVLLVAFRLGLTSFGGPIAHLGYYERSLVRQRQWLGSEEYAGIVALCQLLPGPASSQTFFLIGLRRAGWLGALAAWLGFTLPSALLLYAAAVSAAHLQGPLFDALLRGLKLVAVAVVAQAVWSMARKLCTDRATTALALVAAALLLFAGSAATQWVVLAVGAVGGMLLCRPAPLPSQSLPALVSARAAWVSLTVFAALLLGLPLWAALYPHSLVSLAAIFYRSGALVFGGGHVVLPLLRDALVPSGWISDDRFLVGYGLAQAVPGPVFSFAAYLGAANGDGLSPALAAGVATVFIFMPGLLLAVAGISLWGRLGPHPRFRAALAGLNAAVVGILGAALCTPVWTSAVDDGIDAAIALAGLVLLQAWKIAPIWVLLMCVGLSIARGLM